MTKKTRILICDDHEMFREGVKTVLSLDPEFDVIGEADDGRAAVDQAIRLQPDVVLMDISMPMLKGFDATRRIKRERPGVKVLILTVFDDEGMVARCLDAGASGYILKDSPPMELIHAVQTVQRGLRYISPKLLSGLADAYADGSESVKNGYHLLSDREREVLVLLGEGNSPKNIAMTLNLSIKTVDSHKCNLMRKLDLHDRNGLVRYAIREKLVEA